MDKQTETKSIARTVPRPADGGVQTAAELTNLAKAIALFAFSGLTVRPCGHGLPPTLPYRQDDWTLTEASKSDLRRYSIIDRAVLRRLEVLDQGCIQYDHIYIAHQDKKPFQIPPKVKDVVSKAIPFLAAITLEILTLLAAAATLPASLIAFMLVDPIVIVAIRERDGSYQLLEIAKWYD